MPRRPMRKGPRFTQTLKRTSPTLVKAVSNLAAVAPEPLKPSWLYELHPSQALPTIDLTKTVAASLFIGDVYARVVQFMRTNYRYVLIINRSLSFAYYGMIFVQTSAIRAGIAVSFLGAIVPFCCMAGFVSLDVLKLLSRNYEFLFISAVNTLQWVVLAAIYADIRSVSCLITWLSVQTVIALDGNFRTFPGATKSIIISIPAMLVIGACCVFRLIESGNYFSLHIGALSVSSADIVLFTSTTLALFMTKKVYLKRWRQRRSTWGQHQIPCVVLRARLYLRPVDSSVYGRRLALTKADARTSSVETIAQEPHLQKLRVCKRPLNIIDTRRTVFPALGNLLARPSFRLDDKMTSLLYVVGSAGLLSTVCAWGLLLFSPETHHNAAKVLGVIAAACTMVFTASFFAVCQRDLVRSLFFNFDWVFTNAQLHALALTLCDLLQWRSSHCCAVLACWLWFQWILFLDGLTPPVKRLLRFRKLYAAPVMAGLLIASSGIVAIFLMDNPAHPLLVNRVLWRFRISSGRWYELHTASFAVLRVLTIVGWNMRLVLELPRRNEHELLFVRGSLEYTSPYETFPVGAPQATHVTVQPVSSGS